MTRRRCCDDPRNLRELVDHEGHPYLVCRECSTTVATADDRGELFADY